MNKTAKNRSKRRNKQIHKKGCGCKRTTFFIRKNRKISRASRRKKTKGGNPSFQPFQNSPPQYYYGVNSHNNDPQDPSTLIASRTMPNMSGGKSRKFRGGNPLMSNSLMSFGNLDGASIGSNIVSGTPVASNSVINQPSFTTYNSHRVPLV